jgi:hypothetical protein
MFLTVFYPNVAKAEGLQSQGAKGAAAVGLLQTLGSAGSGGLWLSRGVKRWRKIDPILKFTVGNNAQLQTDPLSGIRRTVDGNACHDKHDA